MKWKAEGMINRFISAIVHFAKGVFVQRRQRVIGELLEFSRLYSSRARVEWGYVRRERRWEREKGWHAGGRGRSNDTAVGGEGGAAVVCSAVALWGCWPST